ncbi:MAG: signal peptidase II [Candidatus Coproplasma sp.]
MFENKKERKLHISYGKAGLILTAVFAVLIATDLLLKYFAWRFEWEFTVIPKLIEVVPMQYNTGAAFSFLNDKAWAQTFFIVLTFIMLAVMIFGFLALPKNFIVLKTAIVLIASGAVGNLVDRLLWGCVRDFVDVWIFGNVACCNFADFWIVFGAILAVIDMLFLNDWSIFPLTKSAKKAQADRKVLEEQEYNAGNNKSTREGAVEVQPDNPSLEDEQNSQAQPENQKPENDGGK